MTLACDSEFIRALIVGAVCGFAMGFFTCAAMTISKGAGK